ncbi:MAG: prolyl oligopeptidase family serine peptidase [Rudaea sp.]
MKSCFTSLAFACLLAGCANTEKKAIAVNPTPATTPAGALEDPYLWLEETDGTKAMDWVKARDAESVQAYGSSPAFEEMRTQILEVMDSDARIPYVSKIGNHFYNFWRDKAHPRGIWRRTTLAEYRKEHPTWEVVIDVDALGKEQGVNWVWHGADCLKPEYRNCLIALSRGGADATVTREYDLKTKAFVKDGFDLPEAKSQVGWIDVNSVYVGTDFGPGSMTKSSYPRLVKEWKRGSPLAAATLVYEGKDTDLAVGAYREHSPGFERDFVERSLAFYNSETFLRGNDGKLVKVDTPNDAKTSVYRQWLTVEPRTPWTVGGKTYPSGSLLTIDFDAFMAGKRDFTVLFTPSASTSLDGYSWTRHHLILNTLEDVVSRLEVLTPPASGGREWRREPLGGAPALSTISAGGIDPDRDDSYFLTVSGYLEPTTLYYGVLGQGAAKPLKHSPTFFDAAKNEVHRYFATSKDGTRVPYFVVAPKGIALDGSNPTLLYGYGGFEVSLQPGYSGGVGRAWLARGGVYVVANIRGGGEYGPRWHQAALKGNRLRAYEDFAAVANDLVERRITSKTHLGAMGGSNGGLLMGNMLTLYPDLWGAIVCQVPLLDMKRYSHLAAGASWMAEYGDPDKPEDWAFIKTFSPYQNVEKARKYPPVLFTTSTRDDRVGPHQARKMAARMLEFGNDVSFYENIEGGHGAAADNKQAAFMNALAYSFLWDHLK